MFFRRRSLYIVANHASQAGGGGFPFLQKSPEHKIFFHLVRQAVQRRDTDRVQVKCLLILHPSFLLESKERDHFLQCRIDKYQGDCKKSCIDLVSTQCEKWKRTGNYLPHNSEHDEPGKMLQEIASHEVINLLIFFFYHTVFLSLFNSHLIPQKQSALHPQCIYQFLSPSFRVHIFCSCKLELLIRLKIFI